MLLSAVLIVRTESDAPEPCLQSIAGLVDEVVVVATLPAGVVASAVAGRAVRMLDVPSGDVIDALNAGLAEAQGEFVLAIEATERAVTADRPRLAALLADEHVLACRVRFRPRLGFTRYWEPRIFRRVPGFRFRGVADDPLRLHVGDIAAGSVRAVVDSDVQMDRVEEEEDGRRGQDRVRTLAPREARIAEDPADVMAWSRLGRALTALGDQRGALRAWRRAVRIVRGKASRDPLDSLPYVELLQHEPREGAAHLDEALLLFPDNYFLVWCHASRLLAAGRYRQALPRLERLTAVEPHTYCDAHVAYDERIFGEFAHGALGLCHFRLGRYRESAQHYGKAEVAAPHDQSYRVKRQLAEVRARAARGSTGASPVARRPAMAIDLVTPLYPPDIERFSMLRASLDRFWHIPGRHLIPVQDSHYEEIATALARHRGVEVVRESSYIDTTAGQVSGWVSMRLRKLGAHQIVGTPLYLCLDADTVVVRPLRYEEIVREGRGYADLLDARLHDEQYEYAAKRFGLVERVPRTLISTPQLFAVDVVAAALGRLEALHGGISWQEILSAPGSWSESALYFTYAQAQGLVDKYHFVPSRPYCTSVWFRRDAETWNFGEAIAPEHVRFCVIQSNLQLPVAWTWERVKHHFPGAAGPVISSGDVAPAQPNRPPPPEAAWDPVREIAARSPLTSVPWRFRSGPKTGQRAMVVAHRIPTPDRTSESVRLMFLLKGIAGEGWDITLVSAAERSKYGWLLADVEQELPRYERPLADLGVQIVYGLKNAIRHLHREGWTYSLAMLSSCHVMYRYAPLVRAYMPWARLIYDVVDLYWLRVDREAAVKANDSALRGKARRFRQMDGVSFEIADGIVAITEEERDRILDACPTAEVAVLPNIHELSAVPPGHRGRAGLVFIGHYPHSPNHDAVQYFCRDILPLIHARLPGVDFHILGSSMPDSITALKSECVHPVGYVPDPGPYFNAARVFVAPLRYGAGMKGKIGLSLSLGLPVVTTPIGAEGMGLRDGEEVLIAEDAPAFADAVWRLHTDDALWDRLSRAGLLYIRQRVSPEAVAPTVRRLLAEAESGVMLG